MATRARSRGALVVVVVLLLALAVTAIGYFLSRDDPSRNDPRATPPGGQPQGALEIGVAPGGARVALIGPDRFVHTSTQFETATLASLRSGGYVLSGTMEGYAAVSQEIVLAPGERRSVELELTQVRSR